MIDRRMLLGASAALPVAAAMPGCATVRGAGVAGGVTALPGWFDDLERRTFAYFWETANPVNGLVPDRWPSPSFCSIAAVGFALTAYPIGVERGWITRAEARARTLTTLRFFDGAPSGPARSGVSGHKGFFYHFLDMQTGHRFHRTELSSVDSTWLFLGMIYAAGWFDGDDADEREIRRLADTIVGRADWPWFQRGKTLVSMGWDPDTGFIARNWDGYNEGMMVYILALGSARHPVTPEAWAAWCAPYDRCWRGSGETRHVAFAPMFGHQFSHVWVDFRGIRDAAMRAAGFDYFENSRRATWAQRAYAIANPLGWDGYGRDAWGLTACDGPADLALPYAGTTRQFHSYSARGPMGQPDERDDGTIAPTAALGSLPFAPEIVVPVVTAMRTRPGLYGQYGFRDAFNPSFRYPDVLSRSGTIDPVRGWIATDWIGIDQGPILAMAANHRSDAVWRVMRRAPAIRRGLERAGFTGGWLEHGG